MIILLIPGSRICATSGDRREHREPDHRIGGGPTYSRTHEGPLPKGGEGMRVSGSERWCSLTHKSAGPCGQREETPHQPPAPLHGERANALPTKCSSGCALIRTSRGGARNRTDARALLRHCCGHLRVAAGVATGPRETFRCAGLVGRGDAVEKAGGDRPSPAVYSPVRGGS